MNPTVERRNYGPRLFIKNFTVLWLQPIPMTQ